jgi:DNA-directed RNA polymerase specialized sigma24 family protein
MTSTTPTPRAALIERQLLECRSSIRAICKYAAIFEDVFQEVAVGCLEKATQDWSVPQHGLILTIARRRYADQVRRFMRRRMEAIAAAAKVIDKRHSLENTFVDRELPTLRAALTHLDARRKRVLLKQEPDSELAIEYGVTIAVIQQWRSRAIRWIRQNFGNFISSI